MPSCAVHSSKMSQFDSQPLSQHAVSQTSELSFGGGAPLHASASMTALHSTKAEAASSMNGSHVDHLNESEHHSDGDDDNDDGDDSQALLQVC
jgi:hypothetical protein